MFEIVSENSQVIMERCGAQKDIKVRNQLTATTKIRTHFCKTFHDRIIDVQEAKRQKKLAKGSKVNLRVRIPKCPFINFAHRYEAYGNASGCKESDGRNRLLLASKSWNNPVRIDDGGYGL
jgi:hypothetical protein